MQSEINLGGKRVLAGLQWHVLSKEKAARAREMRQAKDQAKKANLQYAVTYEGERLAAIGFGSKASTAVSASALLAEANARFLKQQSFGDSSVKRNWIVVERVQTGEGSGLYWLGAVVDGVPAPLGDVVDDFSVISAKIADLVDMMEAPEIFSTDPELQDYVADVAPATPKGFADLIDGVVLKTGRVRKTGGIPRQVVLAGVGVLAILALYGAGSLIADYRAEQHRIAQEKARKEKAEEQARKASEESQQQAVELTKKAISQAMDTVIGSLSARPASRVSYWVATVSSIPVEHGDWAITGIQCDAQSCAVALARQPYGTNDSLLRAVPDAKMNGDTATFTVPLIHSQEDDDKLNPATPAPASAASASQAASAPQASGALAASSAALALPASGVVVGASAPAAASAPTGPAPEASLFDASAQAPALALGTRDQFLRGFASDLQMLRNVGVGYDVSADSPITYKPVAPNPKGAAQPGQANTTELAPVPLGVSQGQFTLKGTGLWMLAGLERVLNRPGLTVEQLQLGSISEGHDQSWTLTGRYFLSTGDGPATAGKQAQEQAQQAPAPALAIAPTAGEAVPIVAASSASEAAAAAIPRGPTPPNVSRGGQGQ
jgi:hypothetical protein